MEIIETEFSGLFIINPKIFQDERGYFFESFNTRAFKAKTGIEVDFVQENEAFSSYGVLRGLHFQTPRFAQSKLVRVAEGSVLDVVVDIREGSKTFGKSYSVILDDKNKYQLFVPRGFAHGYIVLSEKAIFQYNCDNFYHSEAERGIAWNDPELKIEWMVPEDNIILSQKDLENPFLAEAGLVFTKGMVLYPEDRNEE